MDDLFTTIHREWPVIEQAPWSVGTIAVGCLVLGWGVGRFLGSERNRLLVSRLEHRDDEIDRLKDKLAEVEAVAAPSPGKVLPKSVTAPVAEEYMSLRDAASRAFDEVHPDYRTIIGLLEKHNADEVITHFCTLLAPMMTIYGEQLPGTQRRVLSDHAHPDGYGFEFEAGELVAAETYGNGRWANLSVERAELDCVIRDLNRRVMKADASVRPSQA